MYTDVQVTFETHKLPIIKYDDLQGVGSTLPNNLDPNNAEVKAAASILFGFLSFNT